MGVLSQLTSTFSQHVTGFDGFDEAADVSANETARQQCIVAGSTVRQLLERSKVAVNSSTVEIGGLRKSVMADGSIQWISNETNATNKDLGPSFANSAANDQPSQRPNERASPAPPEPSSPQVTSHTPVATQETYTIVTRTGKEATGATVSVRLFGEAHTATADLMLGRKGSFRKHESDRFSLNVPVGQLHLPVRRVEIWHDNSRSGLHGPSWYLEDMEVITPSGDSTTFVVATEQEHWLDAKRGDKKVHRVLHPENELAASASTSPEVTSSSRELNEQVAKSLEIERQRTRLAEEEGAKARAEAEQAWQEALRKVEEAEARAQAAEENAKQSLLEQLTGAIGLGLPRATLAGSSTAASAAATKNGRRSEHKQSGSSATAGQALNLNASVVDWVQALRLEDYQAAIAEAGTSLLDLKEMDVEDVAALGLKRLEEKRFLRALDELKISQK